VAQPVPGDPGQYTATVQFESGGASLLIFNVERECQKAIKTDASLDVIGPEITPVPGP
jgi:hypothetical protein